MMMAVAATTAQATADKKLPNFVMVLADDLGWNAPGYMNPNLITPTLDELAHSGVKMDRAYVYRYCAPTRGSFLTGRYPMRLDATRANLIPWTLPDGINTTYTYLPKKLKEAGYLTHHVGKWHQGFYKYDMTPTGRGFDTSFGFLIGGEDHFTSSAGKAICGHETVVDLSYGFAHNQSIIPSNKNGTYTGYLFADASVAVIKEHPATSPLFLYTALHNTHGPIEAPPDYVAMYNFSLEKQNHFYGQVTFVDHSVKNITDALKSSGLWENTLFIWMTDNGSPPSVAGSNYPLRGGKGSLWDGGYRVPGFINGGLIADSLRGSTFHDPIHIADFWPTFATMAGLSTSDEFGPTPVDGIDQSDYILGKAKNGSRTEMILDHIMYCNPQSDQCVNGQTPDFPGNHYPTHTAGALVKQVDGHLYKLIVGPAQQATWYGKFSPNVTGKINYQDFVGCWPQPCLFDLTADPTEHIDLHSEEKEIYQNLMTRFSAIEHSYHPGQLNPATDEAGLCKAVAKTRGYMAPWYGL